MTNTRPPDPSPHDTAPPVGAPRDLGGGIRAILAPNPSPMTYWGTNTYLLGQRRLAVIDPGPDDPAHLAAILGALGPGQSISHILVTHAHLDHSPLARRLAVETGAPVLAYGGPREGRSAVMARLAAAGEIGGGEGVDARFAPDVALSDGERSEEHTSELQSLRRISYAVFCLKKKKLKPHGSPRIGCATRKKKKET